MKQLIACLCIIFLICCKQSDLFQAYKSINSMNWHYHEAISFDVDISDTISLYHIDINLRHNGNYKYKNCWVWVHFIYPSGEKHSVRKNLQLCDKHGQWYGTGLNNTFDVRNTIQTDAKFQEKGVHKISIEQNMRLNPLPDIIDVGLRIKRKSAPY